LATANNSDVALYTNLGEITNKGIEVNLGWSDAIGTDFKYSVGANFSYNKNKVVAIGDKFDFQITGNGGVNLTQQASLLDTFMVTHRWGFINQQLILQKCQPLPTRYPVILPMLILMGMVQ
jgi:TonB dependent receptor